MDQNIIILVLILIAILVAFYSTYLSIDNSKKIRRLQQDIRESLGNINSTLHLNNDLSSPTVEKPVENKDLEQFPSLEEIENYEKTDLPKARPTSMNNYGVLLDELGLTEGFTDKFMLNYLNSFNAKVFPDYGGDTLDNHKCFTIKYEK